MRAVTLLLACLMMGLMLPWHATAQDLDEVRAERDRIQQRLDAAAQRLGELEASVAELSAERTALEQRVVTLTAEFDAAASRIQDRVRSLYMRGDTHPMIALLGGDDPQAAVQRASLMQRLVAGDTRDAEVAVVAQTQLSTTVARLAEKEAALDQAFAEQKELLAGLEEDLEAARKLEAKLVAEEKARQEAARRKAAEEAARKRREAAARSAPQPSSPSSSGGDTSSAPAPTSGGGMVCPVDSPRSFTDTWGAPRSGGRTHKGTDILAPRGQTVRAIVSGVWDVRPYGASAGHWGILRGGDGNHYYYMHLERHTVGDGARVSAGQQIATNGDTGNARGTTPHVHFELHPGGGYAINPYPTLKRVCG